MPYRRRRYYNYGPRKAIITILLMIVNVVIYLYTFDPLLGIKTEILNAYALSYDTVMAGEWWRLFTAMFLHGNLYHLLGNMLALFRFGITAESATKRWQYLIIYFGSGLVGNLASMYFNSFSIYDIVSIGASGAIFGVLAAAMIGRRKLTADNIAIAGVYVAIYLFYSSGAGIDNWAHIFGAVAGLILMLIFRGTKEEPKKTAKKSTKSTKSVKSAEEDEAEEEK